MAAVQVISMILIAVVAGVLSTRNEDASAKTRWGTIRSIAYWLFSVLLAFELAAGALWDLFRIEYVRVALAHLGYPLYLLVILGVWRIPGAVVLLVPRFARLKEWVYAGAFFEYTGAAASHVFVGDRADQWVGPAIFSAFTLLSSALRPAPRRLPGIASRATNNVISWVVPILAVIGMLAVAFVTLPRAS